MNTPLLNLTLDSTYSGSGISVFSLILTRSKRKTFEYDECEPNFTLNSTNSGYDSLVLSVIFTKNKKNICIFIGPTSYNCLALVSFSRSLPFFNFSRSCQKLVKVVHTKKTIRASPCHSFHSFNSGKGSQKNRFFLGKSPKLWGGGGQES